MKRSLTISACRRYALIWPVRVEKRLIFDEVMNVWKLGACFLWTTCTSGYFIACPWMYWKLKSSRITSNNDVMDADASVARTILMNEATLSSVYRGEVGGQIPHCVLVILRFTPATSLVHWYRYLQRSATSTTTTRHYSQWRPKAPPATQNA